MSTKVRDAIVEFAAKNEGKYFTAEALEEKLKINGGSAGSAMFSLAKRAILTRKKEGRSYVYTAGKRLSFGQKYVGRKFPFHREGKTDGEAIPASAGSVGIIIKIDGQAHAITLAEAKAIFTELKILFG